MAITRSHSFTERLLGAARLDVDVYEEVEADVTATPQAAGVVALVAVASAIGGVGHGVAGVAWGVVAAIVGWLLWALTTYLIGDKLLGGTATWGELLRTLGFAQAPGLLFMFAAAPVLGWIVPAVVGIWMLFTGIVAIRQACDFGTGRAIVTAVLALIPYALLRVLIA
jgi:hypothetical protein